MIFARLQSISVVVFSVLLLALFIVPSSMAAPKSYVIDLPTRTISPPDDGGEWFADRSTGEAAAAIIQFRSHPDQATKRSLSNAGVRLQEYLGGGAWAAYVEAGVSTGSLSSFNIRWAGELTVDDKVDPRLENDMPAWAVTPDGNLYAVALMKHVDDTEAEVLLRDEGAEPGAWISVLNTWHALADADFPERIAQDPRVLFVTAISPPMESMNASVRAAMNVDPLQAPPFNLSGAGEIVCVYDGGSVDINHPDFEGRASYGVGETTQIANHATHVAGTVAGNGDNAHRGMAPGATIFSYYYENCDPYCLYDSPQDIYEDYELAYLDGAHLFTNSIGANIYPNGYNCDWMGDYESVSALLDSLVRGPFGDPLIVTWAAGNERSVSSPCGNAYETMSVPSGAKNVITVGATTANDQMSSFSSWGPTDDGRIKPEVTSVGVNVSSCAAGGGYTTMSGTSMATPAVAGVNALLMQAWHESHDPDTFPLPETVKAILCNSAEDLGNAGPDYIYGFGRVDAFRAVQTVQSFGTVEGAITDDELWTQSFAVPEGLDELRVTVAWSDVPAGYLPAATLVNDLDAGLQSPSGETFLPFILDADIPDAPATTGTNTVDVVEQVVVENPEPGTWIVGVRGTDVPAGPQTFGLAANVPLVEGIYYVSGTVVDAVTGQPVEEAIITTTGQVELGSATDADGEFGFFAPFDTDMLIKVSKLGYVTQYAWVNPDQTNVTIDLQPGAMGTVTGTVTNVDGDIVPGIAVFISEMPQLIVQTNAMGVYELEIPANTLLTVSIEEFVLSAYEQVFVQPGETVTADLVVGLTTDQLTGPDNFGYVAIQHSDNHVQAPVFDWVEIDPGAGGPGITVPLPNEETAVVIDLPFTFTYYDQPYTQITVNENGFFCFGDVTNDPEPADYSNSSIPSSDGPPAMVGPFWEDFRANLTNLSTYDDGAGRFIIEWYDSRQWPDDGTYETFQAILYDVNEYPTGSDNGKILFQYLDVEDLGNATVGIESPDEEDGIEILFFDADGNGGYNESASTITDSSAIVFYRPTAAIEGTVALNPANPDITPLVIIGADTVAANPDGSFEFPMVIPGLVVLDYQASGYEHLVQTVQVFTGDTEIADPVTLWQLQPPTELTYELVDNYALLDWTAPDFARNEIDAFLNQYRVYRDGGLIGQTGELMFTDDEPWEDDTRYWVTALYDGGESDSSNHAYYESVVAGLNDLIPREFSVSPAWPNPFNPSTEVTVSLPETSPLKVAVYDVLGRQVIQLADGAQRKAGRHRMTWNAAGHASGVYFIRVQAGKHEAVRKLMLLK